MAEQNAPVFIESATAECLNVTRGRCINGEAVRLREQGRSLRWIAGVLGVSEHAVHDWCSTVTGVTVEQTVGLDGKARP